MVISECKKWSMGPKWVVHTTLIGVMAKFETSKNQNLSVTLSHSFVIIYVLNLGLSNLSLLTVFGYIQQSTSPKLIKHGSSTNMSLVGALEHVIFFHLGNSHPN